MRNYSVAAFAVLVFALPAHAQLLPPESRAALGGKALEVLRSAMDDPDPAVRASAAQQWGEIGSRAAMPALKVLLRDRDPQVRIAAARSLHQLGDTSGMAALARIVKSPAKKVKKSVKKKKGRVRTSPVEELKMIARDKIRAEAVGVLSQFDSSSTIKLLEGLRKDSSGAVRDAAAAALARLGHEDQLGQFIDALESDDEAERLAAVKTLASVATPTVIEPLHRMVNDSSAHVRAAALRGLGATGSVDVLADLQDGIKDGNALVRSAAIEAMENISVSSAEAAAPLKEALAHETTTYVRLLTIRELGRLGREVDLGLAERSLDQNDVDTRVLAVGVLEAAGMGEWALKLLETALNDSEPRVRVRAAAALVKVLQYAGKR